MVEIYKDFLNNIAIFITKGIYYIPIQDNIQELLFSIQD